MTAKTPENTQGLSIHGRRLQLLGDAEGLALGTDSLVLSSEGVVMASTRSEIVKAITAVAAGPITLTGAKKGDLVLSVTDLSTPGDASSKFETVISVDGQIQQTAASTDVMLVVVRPQS